MTKLLPQALEQKVAYVPSEPFYASNPQVNHFRLSFVTVGPDTIREGIKRLGELIKANI